MMNIRSIVISALRWNTAAKLISQALNWGMTIVIIRLLSPADYGLMAMTMTFVFLLSGLADVGLASAVIQAPRLEMNLLRRVQGFILTTCLGVFVLLQLGAPLIAAFFKEPQLSDLVRVMSLEILIGAPAALSGAMLMRELRVKITSTVELTTGVLSSVVTALLAWKGFGVWSLVFASLVRVSMSTIVLLIVSPLRLNPSFRWTGMSDLFVFGGLSTVNQVLQRLNAQLDSLIAGRVLGSVALGVYSVSMHLASLPAAKLGSIIGDVVFPAFARIQADHAAVRRQLLYAIGLLAFVAFPVFFGLSAVAPEAVTVLLGDRWAMAVIPLTVIPLVMPIRIINGIVATAAYGTGRPGIAVQNQVTLLVLMTIGLTAGGSWGVIGFTFAWAIVLPIVALLGFRKAGKALGLPMATMLSPLLRPAVAAFSMYVVVCTYRMMGGQTLDEPLRLLTMVILGAAAYIATTLIVNRAGAAAFVRLCRDIIR